MKGQITDSISGTLTDSDLESAYLISTMIKKINTLFKSWKMTAKIFEKSIRKLRSSTSKLPR